MLYPALHIEGDEGGGKQRRALNIDQEESRGSTRMMASSCFVPSTMVIAGAKDCKKKKKKMIFGRKVVP